MLPASLPSLLPFTSSSSSLSLCPSGKSMSWSYRAHAIHASGTGTTSALPTCSTCSHSLAFPACHPPLSSLCHSQGTPRVPPALAYRSHVPGLKLLLAWSWKPAWHRAWPRLTLPSFLALWYCCLPGLRCLEHGNKRSQPCFLCLCLPSFGSGYVLGMGH